MNRRTKLGIARDKKIKSLHGGKRVSADGNVYYEYRENRSDFNRTKKFSKGGDLWTPLDFTSIEEYFDYINDSLINGNRTQVKELYNDMDESQKRQFFRYANMQEGMFDEVVNYINENVREYAKGGGISNIKNIDTNSGTKIPNEVYFKGKRYIGRAGFINGFNGYTSTKDDGILCAFTQEKGYDREKLSLWNENGKPNYLTDKDGSKIESKNYRGQSITFEENGFRRFNKGGDVEDENAQMVLNNNKQIKHHTEELPNAVKGNKHIPAWVVAKVNRSASDLSDATHYLDGEKNKMAKGGAFTAFKKGDDVYILENYNKNPYATPIKKEGKVIDFDGKDVSVEWSDGSGSTLNQRFLYKEKYAKGGGLNDSHLDDLYNKSNKNVQGALELYAGELGIYNMFYGHKVDASKKAKYKRAQKYLESKYMENGGVVGDKDRYIKIYNE